MQSFPPVRTTLALLTVTALAGSAVCSSLGARGSSQGTSPAIDLRAARADALKRARVWEAPPVPVSKADLTANPPGPDYLDAARDVPCRFKVTRVGGRTPKFECTLPSGEEAKVRYGRDNPEIPAELAATRLMSALGFPTDRLFAVRSVQCEGCPRFPFFALRCYRRLHAEWACMPFRNERRVRAFAPALVELRHPGGKIESREDEGWSWYELDQVAQASAGAPRAHLDALRLMAVFLAHWDNKGENQRLVCEDAPRRSDGSCSRPLAMVQDLGGSFGPFKVDLKRWSAAPVWADARACAVSMESMPFEGGTFPPARIGEGGRRMVAGLLSELSARQIHDLFAAAGFRDVEGWVRAFRSRVNQIRAAGPCPTA